MESNVTGKVSLPPLAQIGMVVTDINAVMEFYAATFGIGPWQVRDGESEAQSHGQTYRYKTRTAMAKFGPVTLELFQVIEGKSPVHSEFLDRGREGVHHIGFFVTKEERERLVNDLAGAGVGVFQERRSNLFLDTARIGGLFFEFIERPSP